MNFDEKLSKRNPSYIFLLAPQKLFVKKIYGLNLFLHAREARGVAKIQWAAVEAAHQKIEKTDVCSITESIYNTAWTYFNKLNP